MPASQAPVAIIDIGSNSVRLVVYSGSPRIPFPIFNEKVLAGLGQGLAEGKDLRERDQVRALAALARFRLLVKLMGVRKTHVLATAAARDARNGPQFVARIKRLGLDCRVLSAEEEALLAGEGILSSIPGANGIVGDLGGGSLELVDVKDGKAGATLSVPLGVLRVAANSSGASAARDTLRAALKRSGIAKLGRDRPFYMVGGSWRALARVDMAATDYPLPIVHQYLMLPDRAAELRKLVAANDPKLTKALPSARQETSPVAAMLLCLLVDELEPNALVVSSFGIREGLLYSALDRRTRRQDPLIEAARDTGGSTRRFGEHGDLLDAWIGDAFDDSPAMKRIRLASCLLADVAWQANAAFRADRAVEMALHGNWVAVTAAERVMMAHALSSSFGRDKLPDPALAPLCAQGELDRAHAWGLAIRLGQRICGGVGAALAGTRLSLAPGTLQLHVAPRQAALIGEPVERRLARLAEELGRKPEVVAG